MLKTILDKVRREKPFQCLLFFIFVMIFYLLSNHLMSEVPFIHKAGQEMDKIKVQIFNSQIAGPVNNLGTNISKNEQNKITKNHEIGIKERIEESVKQTLDPKINKYLQQNSNSIPSTQKETNKLKEDKDMDTSELQKINSIRNSCGALCDTSRPGTSGPYFNHVTAPVDCEAIYKNPYIDEGHNLKEAPRKIPKELWDEFTMNNKLPVMAWYFDQKYVGHTAKTPVWTKKQVEDYINSAAHGTLQGTYGVSETNALRDGIGHAAGVKNGRVLVIGSENPWVEAVALEQGAKEIVTLEYGRIKSEHSKIKTMVPSEFMKSYLNGTLGLFDAVVTFSSVEHSGLGRYGDRLNPWGDIIQHKA